MVEATQMFIEWGGLSIFDSLQYAKIDQKLDGGKEHIILWPDSYGFAVSGTAVRYKRGLFSKCFQKCAHIIHCLGCTSYLRLAARTRLPMTATTCLIAQIDTSSLLTFVLVPDSVSISAYFQLASNKPKGHEPNWELWHFLTKLLTIWQLNTVLVLPM